MLQKIKTACKRKQSFGLDVKDFITDSTQCQILYANCEGSCSRRVVDVQDKSIVYNYVYLTMYYNDFHKWDEEMDVLKREHVEKIRDEIITKSLRFNLNGEIHFGVIWVYYYVYETKTQKAIPVFKIYKKRSGDEAVFLDAFLNFYESWAFYLDSADFPESLLCLPRNGKYSLSDDCKTLDLEFLCSKDVIKNKIRNRGGGHPKFVPFSQVAILPPLTKISSLITEIMVKIKDIVGLIWKGTNLIKENFINVAIFGFMLWLTVKQNIDSPEALINNLKEIGFKLFHTALREPENLKSLQGCSDILFSGQAAFNINFSDAKESLTQIRSEVTTLAESLKAPRINLSEIVQSCSIICRNIRPFFNAVSYVYPLPPATQIFIRVLDTFCAVGSKMKAVEGPGISEDNLRVFGSKLNIKDKNFQPPKYSKKPKTSDNNMVAEQLLESLSLLKSIEKIWSAEESKLHETLQRSPTNDLSTTLTQFLVEKNGYGIFVMSGSSLPQITAAVVELIEGEFIFKPEGTSVHKVVLPSGKVAGSVFFPVESVAVSVFSLETVREEKKKSFGI